MDVCIYSSIWIHLFIYLYILITQADMLYAFTWMDGEMFISDF